MVLVFLALFGCVTRDGFMSAYAEAKCDYQSRCGDDWTTAAEEYDVDTCHELQMALLEDERLVTDWDPEAGEECLRWTREDRTCEGSDDESDNPCAALFR